MSENISQLKPNEPEQDLGLALTLAQTINEPMILEKDGANVIIFRFYF